MWPLILLAALAEPIFKTGTEHLARTKARLDSQEARRW